MPAIRDVVGVGSEPILCLGRYDNDIRAFGGVAGTCGRDIWTGRWSLVRITS